MAPPLKDIDPKKVRKLASMGLTNVEIAAALDCSDDTLVRRYAEYLNGGRDRLCASLKRRQFSVAMDGNVGMLIWLGKQYLGQTDKAVHQVEDGNLNVTIKRTDAG